MRWARPDQVDALRVRLLNLCSTQGTVILRNPHISHDWIYDIIASAPITRFLAELLGSGIAVENVFVIIKYPGEDFAVPPHQDGINDSIELDRAKAIAVWYALTDTNALNGCVEALPESHLDGYLSTQRATGRYARGGRRPLQAIYSERASGRWIPIPLKAGQACAIDMCCLHKSGPNKTETPRVGVNARYVASGAILRAADVSRPLPLLNGSSTRRVSSLLASSTSHKEKT